MREDRLTCRWLRIMTNNLLHQASPEHPSEWNYYWHLLVSLAKASAREVGASWPLWPVALRVAFNRRKTAESSAPAQEGTRVETLILPFHLLTISQGSSVKRQDGGGDGDCHDGDVSRMRRCCKNLYDTVSTRQLIIPFNALLEIKIWSRSIVSMTTHV